MRKAVGIALVFVLFGLGEVGRAEAQFVSPGQLGDALIFPLWDVNNLNTLIAIESGTNTTHFHRVRFRDEMGSNVLQFTLCLPPFATWSAAISRDGSLTKVESSSTHLVNQSISPLLTTLTGNPTRGYIEVIALRGLTSASSNLAICSDPTLGDDANNGSLMGQVYYVNPAQSPVLAYGANALAIADFFGEKILDFTVLEDSFTADALIFQGTNTPAFLSTEFNSRFFVAPEFGAVTQVVMTFASGPTTGLCPECRVPSSLTFAPFSESGTDLTDFTRTTGGKLANVFNVTSGDIAATGGMLEIFETGFPGDSIPVTGFVVQTTTAPPPGQPFFNVLFPLGIK